MSKVIASTTRLQVGTLCDSKHHLDLKTGKEVEGFAMFTLAERSFKDFLAQYQNATEDVKSRMYAELLKDNDFLYFYEIEEVQ